MSAENEVVLELDDQVEEMSPTAMSDTEYAGLLKSQIDDAADYIDSFISPHRAEATEYYNGEEFGDETDGRSQYISRDVRDTVQSILPSLLRIFHGTSKVCEYAPRFPEDVPMAEQATDYVRYILEEDNRFFVTLHSALKDALVRRNGFIKADWQNEVRVEGYYYSGLDEQALQALISDSSIEITDVQGEPMQGMAPQVDPQTGVELPVPQVYRAQVQRKITEGRVVVEALPPEEVLVDRRAKSLESATLVAHRRTVSVGEMLAMGFEYEEFEDLIGANGEDPLDVNLEFVTRKPEIVDRDADLHDSQRSVYVTECWIRIDRDGDGVAELRHVITAGPQHEDILLDEPCNRCPIFSCTPDPEPHDWSGLSIHDLVRDIQRTKSSIMRSMLDSLALSVHPRMAFVEGQANLDDLLDSDAVGALIRMRSPNAVQPLAVPFVGQQAFPVLNYFDEVKESRTGISKASAGLDPDALQSSTRAAVAATISAAQSKIELIARLVAEQLLRPLYKHILKLICEHQDAPRMIRLRNNWIPMDPRTWDAMMDVGINVAIGQGTEEQRLQALMGIKSTQEQILLQLGPNNPLTNIAQYHNTLSRIVELSGFRDAGQFFTDPATFQPPPPEPPKPDPNELVAQANLLSAQAQAEYNAQKIALERDKAQADIAIKQAEIEMDVNLKLAELQQRYSTQVDVTQIRGALEQQRELIRQQGLLENARINARGRASE